MNKQETQAKLHNFEERLKDVASEIEKLREQLAEAEKPKLRHGDFGINKDGDFRLVINKTNDVLTLAGCYKIGSCIETVDEMEKEGLIFGNVFDLLKEWSKPFENCEIINSEKGEFYFHLETVNRKHISFKLNNTGNWFHASISEAEEIHDKLGHAIAELKKSKGEQK